MQLCHMQLICLQNTLITLLNLVNSKKVNDLNFHWSLFTVFTIIFKLIELLQFLTISKSILIQSIT